MSAGVEACLSGDMSPAELRTELLAITDGVRMITALTNELLDEQQMRSGNVAVHAVPASPRALVEACVRAVQPAVPVPIEVTIGEGVPELVRGCARDSAAVAARVTASDASGAMCR